MALFLVRPIKSRMGKAAKLTFSKAKVDGGFSFLPESAKFFWSMLGSVYLIRQAYGGP